MPKGKKRSSQEDRRWLEAYEAGTGLQEIATESRRAISTVWTGIEAARQEREDLRVREHLLQDAYVRHFDDLMGVTKALAANAKEPSAEGLLRAADLRTELLHEGLRSHIPDSPIWGAVREWGLAATELRQAMRDLEVMIEELIDEEASSAVDLMDREVVAASLVFSVKCLARGQELPQMQYELESDALYWGSYSLSLGGTDEKARPALQGAHADLLRQLSSSPAIEIHGAHLHRWESAKQAVELEVEKIILRGFLPGSCDLCPGKVRGGRRRSRRRAR